MTSRALSSLSLVGFAIALAGLVAWGVAGFHMVTQYQVAETVVVEDEFGDEVEVTEMRDEFRYGLLPDRWYDGAALPIGAGGAFGLAAAWLARRRRHTTG